MLTYFYNINLPIKIQSLWAPRSNKRESTIGLTNIKFATLSLNPLKSSLKSKTNPSTENLHWNVSWAPCWHWMPIFLTGDLGNGPTIITSSSSQSFSITSLQPFIQSSALWITLKEILYFFCLFRLENLNTKATKEFLLWKSETPKGNIH